MSFDAEEMYDDVELSQGEFDELAREVEDTNVQYEKLRHLATPKMACMECGGNGTLAGGSFGAMECPSCNGARVVDHPAAEPMDIPDFAGMRAALSAAAAPAMLNGAVNPAAGMLLPGPQRLPKLSALQSLQKQGKEYAQLHAPALPKLPALPGTPAAATSHDTLGAPGDKELDQLEAGTDVDDEDVIW